MHIEPITPTRRAVVLAGLACVATGSTAQEATSSKQLSPELAQAVANYKRQNATFSKSARVDEDTAFRDLMEAERAMLEAPTRTVEDVALKLEYAISEHLCGGQFGNDMEGMEDAMFHDLVRTLRRIGTA